MMRYKKRWFIISDENDKNIKLIDNGDIWQLKIRSGRYMVNKEKLKTIKGGWIKK